MNTPLRKRHYLAIALSWLSLLTFAQYPELNWAQNMGSTTSDQGVAITTDAAGNVYTTGFFSGTVDFDPSAGITNLTSSGSFDIFISKFDAAGKFIWAKRMGGTQQDVGLAITIDASNNILLMGYFRVTADFDPGPGVANFTSAGEDDIFVCKLDSNGDYQWAYAVGGISFDRGSSIAINSTNDIVVTGTFRQTVDFDPGPGTTSFTNVGLDDSFIVKINGANGTLQWAKQFEFQARGVSIDAANNILTTGAFSGMVDFDPGASVFQLTGIANEAFVLKLEDDGDFVWAVSMGGSSDDVGQVIKTDAAGNVYTTGYFVYGDGSPHDFDPGLGVFNLTPAPDFLSNKDIYVSKLNALGNFVWAKHIAGNGSEEPFGLALDASDNVYITGTFTGTVDFDPGSANYSLTSQGSFSVYVNKLNTAGDFIWAEKPLGTYSGFGRGIAIENTNQVVVTGSFDNTVDFSAGACDFYLTSNGQSDIFIQKLSQTGTPPPYIASFTPTVGLAGTTITLTGINFDPISGNNIVKFNGTTAVVTASTATNITTEVPLGATTGFITVSVGCGMSLSIIQYAVDSCVPANEKNALQQLYNSTDGNNWTNNANWLTTDVSSWYGVTVNGCHVTEIQLGDNGLTGELPYDLVDLNALEVFDVNKNNLSGYVPDSFLFMPNLNVLNLSNNNFVELPNLTTGSLNTTTLDLNVSNNALDFGDLEPNRTFTNFIYTPQAEIPPPQLVGFTVGGTLTIDFSTPGTANSYQWFKEGVSISGATNSILSIPSATVASTGNYTVEIANTLVPGLTLRSAVHQAVASPCGPSPRSSGLLDVTFNHAIDNQTDVSGVGVQSTGKVIVALPTTSIGGTPVDGTVRFNTDGTLDGTFNIIPEYMIPLIQTDDKILGYAFDQVIRYNADGTDDFAFNGNAPQSYSSSLYAMALQPDGKILYSIESYMGSRELVRLNTDGTVDPSFIIQSILASVIKVQADGKILIASNGIVSRLNSDGTGDLSFSVGLENSSTVTDLAIQPDGKILIAGNFTGVDGVPHFGIARINADGSLDNTFSAIGVAELGSYDGPYKIGLMSNGQIILAGHFESVNGAPRKNLVRLNSNGSLDCGFDARGSTDQYISGMALQPDNKILITGYFTDYDGTTRYGLARVTNGVGQITIDAQPANLTVCAGQPATFTTVASGAANITYQWQFSSSLTGSFVDVSNGGGYTNASTPTLSINTSSSFGSGYYICRIDGDLATTVFTNPVQLIINPIPATPTTTNGNRCGTGSVTLSASGGLPGEFRWYTNSTGGTAISGEVNSSFTTPSISSTISYFVSVTVNGCESQRAPVTATILTNGCAPVITTQQLVTQLEGKIEINLQPLITSPGTLDPASLKVITQPASGAIATITNFLLHIDYKGRLFSGVESILIEVCNTDGICAQQQFTIEVAGEIVVYNAVSPNGDDKNPFLFLQYIDVIPETKTNRVTIFNRWGDEVFSVSDYDNKTKVFIGLTNDGSKLPAGTYFYKIELPLAGKSLSGFFDLKY